MTTHLIRCGSLKINVHDQGKGLPFLMAHGMWCDHHAFDDVVAGLDAACRTVCPDLRGHGGSTTPTRDWSVMDLARDLLNIMDSLALPKAVVVGHSLGGMAALHMALMYPDRLRGLVLLSTSADAETPERRSQLRFLALSIRMSGMKSWMVRRAAGTFFSPDYARQAPDNVRAWCEGVRAMKKRALLQAVAAVRTRPSVVERLDTIAIPALVIGTHDDPIADSAHATVMARKLGNASLMMLPGGGHALPMEHPQELIQALGRFRNDRI